MNLRLLQTVQRGLPPHLPVRVLADRSIGTSSALMKGILAMGWYFLFRVIRQSKLTLPDGTAVTFYDQMTAPGQSYQAQDLVFTEQRRVPAQVRVLWRAGTQEPWALVTNHPRLDGLEYAKRFNGSGKFPEPLSISRHLL